MLKRIASEYPDNPAQYSKNSAGVFEPLSYRSYYHLVLDFASGLLAIGETRGSRIGLISDNRAEWQHCSMAIMAIGGADVPRGCDANAREISYILRLPAVALQSWKMKPKCKKSSTADNPCRS